MCKKCKNEKCFHAGKQNHFMQGENTCVSYADGEEKPRSGFVDLEGMITITWPVGAPI